MKPLVGRCCSLALATVVAANASAQGTMDDVERLRKLTAQRAEITKLIGDLDSLRKMADTIAEQKTIECTGAFGHQMFCACIAKNIPVEMEFGTYALLLGKGRESFGYPDKVSADDKAQIDTAYTARENCVKEAFGTASKPSSSAPKR